MVRNKFIICREYNIQPSEIDKMIFYEYEYLIEDIKDHVKNQEKQKAEEEKRYKTPSMNSMMNQQRSMMNNYSVPKVSIPKI